MAVGNYLQDPMAQDAINKLSETPGIGSLLTIWSIIQAFYFIVFHAVFSATPGKMFLHIHVETAEGNKLSWSSSIVRYLCSILSQFIYGFGYLIVLFDPRRRALHDWIARTFVVYDAPKRKSGTEETSN